MRYQPAVWLLLAAYCGDAIADDDVRHANAAVSAAVGSLYMLHQGSAHDQTPLCGNNNTHMDVITSVVVTFLCNVLKHNVHRQ